MEEFKTRGQRRRFQTLEKRRKLVSGAAVVGTGLAIAPVALTLPGTQVEAAEYNYQQADAAQSLINQIGSTASQIAAANDLYASVMIAQALLESGNGGSTLSQAPYYNLFGVKGYSDSNPVYLATQEYLDGQWVTMNEPFQTYNSYWESIQEHANVLKSTSFASGTAHYSGAWKSNTSSYQDATAYLTGRYATDPSYGSKLNYLISAYGLTQYDTPSTGATTTTSTTATTTEVSTSVSATTTTTDSSNTSSTGGSYTVVAGDSLWGIASKYGISVDQLMANNGLTSDVIMIGQQLSV
ncbi:glucosaminidase domain-containing protein [Enterococcus asini]|uniref:glucosaminidase domain-containing protein n=1 Tax=Enterococcus asini TaxID=57732 RepID=UPI0032E42361